MSAPLSATASAAPTQALRHIGQLPGPPTLPLIGNAHQFKITTMHRTVHGWALQYGPMFRVTLGVTDVLVVGDHALVTGMLKERPHTFRRAANIADVMLELGIKPGVFNAEGQTWLNQRRMVMASFSPGHIRAYHPSLQRVAERLRRRWMLAAGEARSIDLLPDLMRYTVDVISGLSFGVDINTLEGGEDVIQRHLDKIFPAVFNRMISVVPYWRLVKLPKDRQVERSVAIVNQAIDGFIVQARERMRADPALRERPGNLLEAMINAADQEGSGVDDRDVAGNMFTMLLAGEDTTASTLAWLIHLLALNPHTLRHAQDEVRRAADPQGHIPPDQLDSLPFLEACIHETMRLKPVAMVHPLQALKDTVVGDVVVPAGSEIWGMARHDSVSAEHVPDPEAFLPERWLDGAAAVKRVSQPFGAGPRVCPGRYLALLEIKMAMATLLAHFDIDSVDTPDGQPAQELLTFTMSPVGLSMKLRARA